jgi:hypothetical protein
LRWNPQSAVIVDQKWLKDLLQSVELKPPLIWTVQIAQEHFLDTPDILKQLESLITCPTENQSWMEPILLDLS